MKTPSRQALVPVLLLLAAIVPSRAQIPGSTNESSLMEARSIKLPNATMYYRLFKPKNYDKSKQYPVVVALHGGGERGADNKIQVDREDLPHPWIEDSIQARVPHFVMIPQAPADSTWGGLSGGTGIGGTGQGIIDILDSLAREFSIDTNRYYVTGLSMGGAGTYNLLKYRPGYFAAAAPCAAGGDTTLASTYAKTPMWLFQGSLDVRAPSTDPGNRLMAKALEGIGIKVVRFVSQAAITGPSLSAYRDALRNGTKAVDLVGKNPTPPVTWDSLTRAVDKGANHLYSELTGGDHRSGWMIAYHNPLLARWMFSKVRGASSVTLAPRILKARSRSNRATLVFGDWTEASGNGIFSIQGRRLDAPGAGPAARGPALLLAPR